MSSKRSRVSASGTYKNNATFANPKYVARVNRKYASRRAAAVVPAVFTVSRRRARVVNPDLKEKKYLDSTFSIAAAGSDAAASTLVQSLSIVPQGNTVNTRQGKKIRCMRLQMRGNVHEIDGATSGNSSVRLSIVWDREPDKAALVPTTTDIYETNSPFAMTNRDNAPRFKILKEMCWDFGTTYTGTSSGTTNMKHFKEFLSFSKKDLEVIWTKTDTTGAVAAMVKGDLLAVWTFSSTIAGGNLAVVGNARLDYDDQ